MVLTRSSPRNAAVAGLAGLALAMGVGRFAFTPLLPLMQKDAGVTLAGGAWLAAANYLGYLMGALAAFGSHAHASNAIRAALAATALATIGMAVVHGLAAWFALRWVAGFASASLLICISAWTLERIASSALSGLLFSGVGAGIFSVGVTVLVLDAFGFSSSGAWIVLGTASAVIALVLWPVFSGDASAPGTGPAGVPQKTWRVVLAYGLFGFGYIIPATFLPVMARSGADAEALGFAWPVFGLAACVSTFFAARMPGSPLRLWAHAQVLLIIGVAVPLFSSDLRAVVVSGALVGGTFMVITMAGMQSAKALGGASPRRLIAAMTAAFGTGQLAGPVIVPYAVGPGGVFTRVLVLAVAALAIALYLLPPDQEAAT